MTRHVVSPSGRSRWPRAGLAATCALVWVVANAPSAHAANWYLYAWSGVPRGGRGEAGREVIFSSSNTRKFNWSGYVDDICPADGKGMELQIYVDYVGAGYWRRGNVVQDVGGCEGEGTIVNYQITFVSPSPIQQLRGELWTTEGGAPESLIDYSVWKDNPYT